MNIFTKDFKKAITNRGKEYFNALKDYDNNLKNNEFFDYFDEDKFMITDIKFIGGTGDNFADFETNFDSIKISYQIERTYSGCGSDWYDCEIIFPSWILDDRESFTKRLLEKKKWFGNKREEARLAQARKDKNDLIALASKLGYKIEKK